MAWYDRYKEERILIQQKGGHNKFWAAWYNEDTNDVHVRWARIGTKGQSQVKGFTSAYQAANFISSKFSEKQRKGYLDKYQGKQITQATLDQLNAEAAIVGTQNKCHQFQWVELKQNNGTISYNPITEERLYDPSCNPGILVNFETRKPIDDRSHFTFLFTLEKAFDVSAKIRQVSPDQQIQPKHPLYDMVKKVEEAIGRNLGA